MKKVQNKCPGCSRHCSLSAPKCKYGCKLAAKLQAERKESAAPKYKWEKFIDGDGLLHQMLLTSRGLKKSLKQGKTTQADVLAVLSADEQAALSAMLAKLHGAVPPPKMKKHV